MTITDYIVRGYEKSYLTDLRNRKRLGFEQCSKPQILFKDIIDNSEMPFIPKIKVKHHKVIDLDPYLGTYQTTRNPPSDYRFSHPYQYELENLTFNYNQFVKLLSRQIDDLALLACPFIYVDTLEELNKMIEALNSSQIFAFDVHNHSYRSYLGFSCFIEISTEKQDFVIDALKLRDHLYILNDPFSNPKIVKLALDAKDKLLWFQRDFGVYVQNLFDLKFMLNTLELPNSLPFITNKFLEFSFKNIYVEFDFRKRPISNNEKQYLRSFSHFVLRLLYKLKSIVPKFSIDSLYEEIFEESRKLCLMQYEKPSWEEGHYNIVGEMKAQLNINKINKLKKLAFWRDTFARIEDESREFVLSDEYLGSLVIDPPRDLESLKNYLKSVGNDISSTNSEAIWQIIEEKTIFEEKKSHSKFEITENGNEILHSLFTPSRNFVRILNSTTEKESPAYEQQDLHKLIHWSSGKKNELCEQFATPRKNFDDILSRQRLTPSILKDSPSENISEELLHVLSIVNMKTETHQIKKEIFKLSSYKGSESKLKEIKEEDQVDVIEFTTSTEELPQSVGEIYELGNCIRRKNKNKKKKDYRAPKPEGFFNFEAIQQKPEIHRKMSQKSNEEDPINSDSILRELGWIDN